jgi:hypothetical protein
MKKIEKILIIPTKTALLPEVDVYKRFFSARNIDVDVAGERNKNNVSQNEYSIIWQFMGIGLHSVNSDQILVHEYQSLSTPPFSRAKNQIKKVINRKPSIRIFQNRFIADTLKFKDNVSSFFRPMGIDTSFFPKKDVSLKKYDFVYSGAINSSRNVLENIDLISEIFPQKKILLIGSNSNEVAKYVASHHNIYSVGKVQYSEVPRYLRQAEYGLNIVPNIFPYSTQMSTKLLEYCAVGLKIISFPTDDAMSLEKIYGGKFLYLDRQNRNSIAKGIAKYPFKTPDVSSFLWERIMNQVVENFRIHGIYL